MKRLYLLLAFLMAFGTLSAAERGYVAVPDGKLYYEISGAGEPLIFVHGHSLDRRM